MKRRFQHQHRSGAATVEFALVMPLLLFLFAAGVDFARVYQQLQVLSVCAESGALYASDADLAGNSPFESVEDAAKAGAGSLADLLVVESAETVDRLGNPCVKVTVRCPFKTLRLLPTLPGELELSRTVSMRLLPSADEEP